MKKVLAVVLAAMMILSFAACGKTESETADPIHFAGSSSLAPVIASIAAEFQKEYGTWDKVDPSLPKAPIDISVTSGGSGDGPSSVIDKTAQFGMLARNVKDSEKEGLGEGYTEYMVASDALTVSVNAENPAAELLSGMDTELIRKIFSGEIGFWDEVDPALPHKEIVVIIRDLSGGAAEVFDKKVMQGTPVSENAIQSASMGALAEKLTQNVYAIGYAGFGVYTLNKDKLHAFSVDGVEPTAENIENGSYAIQRPVLFVTNHEPTPTEQAFIDYIFSDAGRKIVTENGYIPVF